MSFRPTVSVYIGGSIADITYFRNALPETLLFESVALVLLYGGCSRSEYLLQRTAIAPSPTEGKVAVRP